MRLAGVDWSFVGSVEDERGHLIDLKLVAKHVGQAAADSDPQAAGYLLARHLEGRPAPRFEFHSIRRGVVRTGERCLAVPTGAATPSSTRSPHASPRPPGRSIDAPKAAARLASPDGWWCAPGQCSFWSSRPAAGHS